MFLFRVVATPLVIVLLLAGAAARAAAGPPPGFVLSEDPDLAFTSPDGTLRLEQYLKESDDLDIAWQVWARRGDTMTELKPAQGYPASFRFTADSQWLVRMQKTGAGEQELYLYRRGTDGLVPATRRSLGELAWAYFRSRPEGRRMRLDFHLSANLVKGTEQAYRELGVDWPDNRYLVISLSGEMDRHPKSVAAKGLADWRCRYDLTTGRFDVPEAFATSNAAAVRWEIRR